MSCKTPFRSGAPFTHRLIRQAAQLRSLIPFVEICGTPGESGEATSELEVDIEDELEP